MTFVRLSLVAILLASIAGGNKILDGVSLFGTTVDDISRSGANRNVVVEITNHLDIPLFGGQKYINWGYSRIPTRPKILPHTREAFLFESAIFTATGAAGCLSYTIADPKGHVRFLVVFSVPYNYIHASNWFGLKIIPGQADINQKMYYSAYYDKAWKNPTSTAKYGYAYNGKKVSISQGNYVISATMTNKGKSILRVNVFKNGGGYYKG